MNTNKQANIQVLTITQGALTIALVFVSFLLFRGATNILNAFFVPVILYFFSIGKKTRDIIAVDCLLAGFCAVFFTMQIVFILIYCGIAYLLSILNHFRIHAAIASLVLTTGVSFCFWLGILLTDFLFGTRVNTIMMGLFKGNAAVYILMLLFEGALVGISLLLISRKLQKRFIKISRQSDNV